MSDYGVTKNGFVLKRMDTILKEIHADLTEGFGVDTRLSKTSFLNVLVTTFANQIANLWEVGQESYYAKYPATATGINLDNAVQYGGIRRKEKKKTVYPLYCTGMDGTTVPEGHNVGTSTTPQVKLTAQSAYTISRSTANAIAIRVALAEENAIYKVTINSDSYSFTSTNNTVADILTGLKSAINNADYSVKVNDNMLVITDTFIRRNSAFVLSENLTTTSVTTVANYETEEYGKITIPYGLVTQIITNVAGLDSVTNQIDPSYGRNRQTDVELRHDYINKSAIRSNRMIDSIVSEIINSVDGVQMAMGYENDTNEVDTKGLPPHSINIIVEGGEDAQIAAAILSKKAGGIQAYGEITVDVNGNYGDVIPISFDRPQYVYTWLKVVLHGNKKTIPENYATLTAEAIANDWTDISAGSDMLVQKIDNSIYSNVSGVTYVDITHATSTNKSYIPSTGDYSEGNIPVSYKQKIHIDSTRIEVTFVEDA